MGLVQEFKEFALKGNVVDLAVGVIIGGAFGKIVSSMVADIVMPLVSVFTSGVSFTSWKYVLPVAVIPGTLPATINYGQFLQNVFDFTVVALIIFMAVKAMNKMKRETPVEAIPTQPTIEEKLLTDIRDILQKQAV